MTTNVQSPELVTIAPATYLVVDGTGIPEGSQFQAAVKAIYSVAYTLKMQLRVEGQDFKIAGWRTSSRVPACRRCTSDPLRPNPRPWA